MRTFQDIAELGEAASSQLGHSDWHTVTQEQIDTVARATGDHQWIHVDPVKAAQGPFGTTIAHGYLTLSLVPLPIWQVNQGRGHDDGSQLRCQQSAIPGTIAGGLQGACRCRAAVGHCERSRPPHHPEQQTSSRSAGC